MEIEKQFQIKHNVSINIYDDVTHKLVQHHQGHNAATNSMLTGMAHYLMGDGIANQAYATLSDWVPRYISLGTMGLGSQEQDDEGLPVLLGTTDDSKDEKTQCELYVNQLPGFGADGYNANQNNGRKNFGLGPVFDDKTRADYPEAVNCELLLNQNRRSMISFRQLVPEKEAELAKTIDVVFSAMIGTGALAKFRAKNKNYLFITEAGLWSKPTYTTGGDNGLLAGYRILPTEESQLDMSVEENRHILKQQILRVGMNQSVQVIWKIQLGAYDDFKSNNKFNNIVTVSYITITKNPDKMNYDLGDTLNYTGMEVTATFTDGTKKKLDKSNGTSEGWSFKDPDLTIKHMESESFIITYTDDYGYLATTTLTVKCNTRVTSMTIEKNPDKMYYTQGEVVDPTGMKIRVEYSNGTVLYPNQILK